MGVSTKVFQQVFLCLPDSDHMENIDGYLMKYTNLVTGWQYRCAYIEISYIFFIFYQRGILT